MPQNQPLLDQLLALPVQERAKITQALLNSLDAEQDADDCTELWANESEARLAAAQRGEIRRVSETDVFAKYEPPTPVDINQITNPLLRDSIAAMHRAAEMAREIAIQTNTGIVVTRNGEIVHVSANELRAEKAAKANDPT